MRVVLPSGRREALRVLVECNHCGAPLDIVSGARVVACAYCHRQHQVPRMKTLAPDTPSDWRPPEVWTPPQEAKARSRPLRFHPVKIVAGIVLTLWRVIGTLLLLATIAPALYFLYQQLQPLAEPGVASAIGDADGLGKLAKQVLTKKNLDKVADAIDAVNERVRAGGSWDGTQPFRCSGNDHVTLTGVTAQLPRGRTAITAEANCELHLVGCTVEAWEGIAVQGNAHVLLEGSRIQAKGVAVEIEGNGQLELVDSTLEADRIAVRGKNNARVVLASGRVAGKQAALVLQHNGRAEVREAELEGKVRARRGQVEGLARGK